MTSSEKRPTRTKATLVVSQTLKTQGNGACASMVRCKKLARGKAEAWSGHSGVAALAPLLPLVDPYLAATPRAGSGNNTLLLIPHLYAWSRSLAPCLVSVFSQALHQLKQSPSLPMTGLRTTSRARTLKAVSVYSSATRMNSAHPRARGLPLAQVAKVPTRPPRVSSQTQQHATSIAQSGAARHGVFK